MCCVSCWLWMEKCICCAQTLVLIIWHWCYGRLLQCLELLRHQIHLCWYMNCLRCILPTVFMFVKVLENESSAFSFLVHTILETPAVLLTYRCFCLHEIIIRLTTIDSAFNVTVVIGRNWQLVWHFLLLYRVISNTKLCLWLLLLYWLRLYILPEILLVKFLHGCVSRTGWRLSTLSSCLNVLTLDLALA